MNLIFQHMIDRSSKRLSATLYKGKDFNSFLEATIQNISKQYSKLKTITSDNGSENTRLNMRLLKIDIVLMHIHLDKKGPIEHKHKQFRKFFPKGVSFKNLTQDKLEIFKNLINSNNLFIFE